MNSNISVEELIDWIERATNDYDEDWQFHSWDVEYAQDTLNGFLPNLGEYVSLLRRNRPVGTAEFYRRSLVILLNIFKLIDVKDIEDQVLHAKVVSTFEQALGVIK